MKFEIEKPKTWKGLSYVLKSSLLKNELFEEGMNVNVHLVYWTPQRNNQTDCSLIEAEYWLPSGNVSEDRFYIRTGVVSSEHRKKAEDLMVKNVLPLLIEWMKNSINKPVNSTRKNRAFIALFQNYELVIV